MAGLSTGAGAPVVKVYHEKSMILPDVSRVLACLYEKDVKFETVKDSYKDILRLQASRSVPVPFYDGPTYLQESRAICRYIAETHEQRGYPFLLGKDVLERASIEQWLRHEEHAFDPPSRALFCHLAFLFDDEEDDDDINKETRKLEEVLEVYEQRLGECEFLAGNKFTLADLVHLPNTHHIVTSARFPELYESRKNVQRWWKTISARESWQKVLRDMDIVEKQYQLDQLEELKQQEEEQWHTEFLSTSGGYNVRIDPRQQPGTKSRTILLQPPSAGIISTSFSSVPQEEQVLPSDNKSSPRKENNFFITTEKTPTPRPITPDKSHPSDFFKGSSHTDEIATVRKPSPPEASETSNKIPETHEAGEAVAPHKSSSRPTKALHESDEHGFYKTETKPASVDPRFDKPDPYTKPTINIPQTSYERPPAKRDLGTSPGTEADETSSDLRGGVQPPYAQKRAELVKIASADQKAATHLPEHVASVQAHTQEVSKEDRQADQKRVTATPPREEPSESKEDTHNITGEDDRFSTKRLRKMLEESEKEAKSQPTDFQPSKEGETPSIYKQPSDVQDRTVLDDLKTGSSLSAGTQAPDFPTSAAERRVASPKGGMSHDDGATEPKKSPSINEQEKVPVVPSHAPPASSWHAPESSNEASPDDGLTPPIKQAAPDAPSNDELAKTAGIDKRTPSSTPKQTPSDARNASAAGQGAGRDNGNEQSDKNSSVDERAPQMTPGQALPADNQSTLASTQERISGARGTSDDLFGQKSGVDQSVAPVIPKKTMVQGAVSDVRGTSDDDRAMKLAAGEKEASNPPKQKPVSSSQQSEQTIEPIKGTTPTSYGITGDGSAKTSITDERPTPSSVVQAAASTGQSASTALKGGVPDVRGKNLAVKPSTTDPTGMPNTPRRQEPTPETQRRHTADQVSGQAPLPSSFASTRNKENGISEAGQTNTIAPDEQPGGGVTKDAAGPSLMKSQKNMNEAYIDGASPEQLPSDQYRSQPAENKKKQGADGAVDNEIYKSKKDDFLANPNQTSTGKVQASSTEETSKLQMQSGLDKTTSSKDRNETESYRSSATSKEMLPSVPDRSTKAQQMQGDKSSMSPQDNVKQGSETALQGYGTEQPKKGDLPANADEKIGITTGEALQKSEERTSSNTEQVKSNRNSSKSDDSTKSTPFDGNEGNLPESQRRGSSSNQ
ncbi:hypothetical protein ABZP36_028116 [Zizania latifolia]